MAEAPVPEAEVAVALGEGEGEGALAHLDDAKVRERLAHVERKPPLYRAFRWTLYGLFLCTAAWLVGSITIAIWRSVFSAEAAGHGAAPAAAVAAPATPAPAKEP